jgi:hypothetical protein
MANNRRDFLKRAALAGAGAAMYQAMGKGRAWAFAQSPTNIRKSVTSLPGLGPSAQNENRPVHSVGYKTFDQVQKLGGSVQRGAIHNSANLCT